MKNKCPYPRCKVQKDREQFACRTHWYSLPKKIRDDVWAGYSGNGDWNKAHQEALAFWNRAENVGV